MSLSKPSPFSSASVIGYDEDLLTIIFLKLPPNSILKCRCVCKQWHSIASNPQFCRQHISLHALNPTPSGILFDRRFDNGHFDFCSLSSGTNRIVSFNYLNPPPYGILSLLSSSNGLLLFGFSTLPNRRPDKLYVCNPTTRKFVTLELPNYLIKPPRLDATLAFDPCVSPHYKVVFLWRDFGNRYCFAVYSSETKTYRKFTRSYPQQTVEVIERSGVFCNGKIHWLCQCRTKSFYFDVETGRLKAFNLPEEYTLGRTKNWVGAFRGRLHAVVSGLDHTYVYEMKEDYSGWVVKYNIGCSIPYAMLCYFCKVEDEGSTTLVHLDESGKILVYNLKEETTIEVCSLIRFPSRCVNEIVGCYDWFSSKYQWIETLSSV